MFTGIVTDIGEIVTLTPGGQSGAQAGDRRFVVRTKHDMKPIASARRSPARAAA